MATHLSPSSSAAMNVDADYIRRAIRQASPNALRMALIEATGDPALTAMQAERRAIRGGAMIVPVVSREDRVIVAEKAFAHLAQGAGRAPATMDRTRAAELLQLFGADMSTAAKQRLALDDLGFPDPDSGTLGGRLLEPAQLAARDVTIIGAGISGIALALRLKALGIPFRILERQSGIGGTWCLNDYPEARVDISTFIYQFRFERNYPWSSLYAPQPEIKRYLEHVIAKYGLAENIQLDTTVDRARWDAAKGKWILATTRCDHDQERVETNFLVSAAGLFSTPNLPDIAGIDGFRGRVFHTTGWHHDYDLAGKRVALIGNGSSGVQLMPWLARTAASLSVFQRTPNWITPIDDYRKPVTEELNWLFAALPSYWHWHCYAMSVLDNQVEALQVEDPVWIAAGGGFNERNDLYRIFLEAYIRGKLVGRPNLIDKSIPTYPPLARRLVVDSGWFDALLRPNVDLISEGIERFVDDGIVTTDGRHRQLDAVVLGTGFRASEFLCSVDYEGNGGTRLADLWAADGARAYQGMFLPDFPNFVVFYGPNGQPQSGSFHDWADRCARLAVDLILDVADRNAQSFAIKRTAFDHYNRAMDHRMRQMIWGRDGSGGYYINPHGRPITKMPWRSHEYFAFIDGPEATSFDYL